MKTFPLAIALLCAVPAWAVTPVVIEVPKSPTAVPSAAAERPAPATLSLKFVKVPLGNVTRVLSARFNVQVSIAANAKAPITGDFTRLALQPALAEAARQAGLVVTALGADASAGYSLGPPEAKKPEAAPTGTAAAPSAAETQAQLDAASRLRAELLRQRASLLEKSAPSDPET